MAPISLFEIQNWGLIEYQEAWAKQTELQNHVIQKKNSNQPTPAYLIYCEHPSVYTAGRRTSKEDLPDKSQMNYDPIKGDLLNGAKVIEVNRGGKITWHGPGQLVIYPIFELKKSNDVVGYVRVLEEAIIDTLAEFGLNAVRYCERTGVWFRDPAHPEKDRKIAAIGIRVSRGVTLHGVGININSDLSNFEYINPCGFTDTGVTSLSKELGRQITIDEFLPALNKHLPVRLADISATSIATSNQLESTLI